METQTRTSIFPIGPDGLPVYPTRSEAIAQVEKLHSQLAEALRIIRSAAATSALSQDEKANARFFLATVDSAYLDEKILAAHAAYLDAVRDRNADAEFLRRDWERVRFERDGEVDTKSNAPQRLMLRGADLSKRDVAFLRGCIKASDGALGDVLTVQVASRLLAVYWRSGASCGIGPCRHDALKGIGVRS